MSVVGAAIKGFGKALAKGKKAKLKTVYRVKPSVNISSYKKSKKHGLAKKLDVWSNREAAIAMEQAGKGVTMKFKKSGMPYVKTGTKPSMLTKAKGYTKLVAPLAGALTVGAVHGKSKSKK